MELEELRHPRWGTFSVIDHLDPASLIDDVLLFDKLILPTPSDEDGEEQDWIDQGWRPDQLATRIVQLGDLVYTMPWTQTLRAEWRTRWERLERIGVESDGMARGLTPELLATKALEDFVKHADPADQPKVTPIVVAAYQSASLAKKDFGVREAEDHEIEGAVAALFTRKLATPLREGDAEEAFHSAVRLAGSESFQAARRALFAWEDAVATKAIPVDDAIRNLEECAATYDELVKTHFRRTVTHTFVRIVAVAAGALIADRIDHAALGALSAYGVDRIAARFPELDAPEDKPDDSPGAALAQAERAISALYHGEKA